jgi:hypothetical protein
MKPFLCPLFFLFSVGLYANKKCSLSKVYHKYDVQFSVFNASIGMPPHFVDGRIQPGINIGLEKIKEKRNTFLHHYAIGYFAHRSLQRINYLKAGYGYRFQIIKSLYLKPALNLSAMMVRQTNREFIFKNGSYEEANRNRLQLMPSFSIDMSLPIAALKRRKINTFFRYEFGVQLPFSQLSSILPINQLHLGVSFHLNKK